MNTISSIINGITTAITTANQGHTARKVADAESRSANTTYRMLPLIILAAIVLIIVITKQ